jgi:hypothetical protein
MESERRTPPKVPLPREHGAWGILLVPFLTAVLVAGRLTPAVPLALAAVVLAFLARFPLEVLLAPAGREARVGPELARARHFAWVYGLGLLGTGAVLVGGWKLYLLVPLGGLAGALFGLHIRAARRGSERRLGEELLTTSGLTLSALAGWIAATGGVDGRGLLVWVLNATFFCAGVVYVKSRIQARRAGLRGEDRFPRGVVLGFHLLLVALASALVALRWASALVVVPFALAAARASWGLRRSGQPFALRRLGWSEVGLSLLFAGFLALGLRG